MCSEKCHVSAFLRGLKIWYESVLWAIATRFSQYPANCLAGPVRWYECETATGRPRQHLQQMVCRDVLALMDRVPLLDGFDLFERCPCHCWNTAWTSPNVWLPVDCSPVLWALDCMAMTMHTGESLALFHSHADSFVITNDFWSDQFLWATAMNFFFSQVSCRHSWGSSSRSLLAFICALGMSATIPRAAVTCDYHVTVSPRTHEQLRDKETLCCALTSWSTVSRMAGGTSCTFEMLAQRAFPLCRPIQEFCTAGVNRRRHWSRVCGVRQRDCFWLYLLRTRVDGLHDHRSCIGSATFPRKCVTSGIF